jgi:indole-3-acetate monooxygenase
VALSSGLPLLAEGAGSVGWNLGNGGVGQLVTPGLPDDGVHEIYGKRADTIIAGTAVPGGGQATPVAGGYRVSGHCMLSRPERRIAA